MGLPTGSFVIGWPVVVIFLLRASRHQKKKKLINAEHPHDSVEL